MIWRKADAGEARRHFRPIAQHRRIDSDGPRAWQFASSMASLSRRNSCLRLLGFAGFGLLDPAQQLFHAVLRDELRRGKGPE